MAEGGRPALIKLPYDPHKCQRVFHQSQARFRVLACGRRFGKTSAAIWECFDAAISRPRSRVWYIGYDYKQSKPVWNMMISEYPKEYILPGGIKQVEKEIHLVNRAVVEMKSADQLDGLRAVGKDLIMVVFDEFAYVPKYIWTIMRPALMDNKARAVFISTPKGRNHFYEFWLRGQKGSPSYRPDWESWKFSSYENPFLDPREIDDLIRDEGMTPLDVAREIYADFIEAAGHVFSLEAIDACVRGHGLGEPSAAEVIGLDLARVENFSVAIAMDKSGRVVGCKSMQGAWTAQAAAVRHMWERHGRPMVYFDCTGVGDAFRPFLIQQGIQPLRGIDFRTYKRQLVENLKVAIEEQLISFPHLPELVRELQHFEARENSSGKIDYTAPRGFHDDHVMALALAYWGIKQRSGKSGELVRVFSLRRKPFRVEHAAALMP